MCFQVGPSTLIYYPHWGLAGAPPKVHWEDNGRIARAVGGAGGLGAAGCYGPLECGLPFGSLARFLCAVISAPRSHAHIHARTCAHTHTHTRARAHTHKALDTIVVSGVADPSDPTQWLEPVSPLLLSAFFFPLSSFFFPLSSFLFFLFLVSSFPFFLVLVFLVVFLFVPHPLLPPTPCSACHGAVRSRRFPLQRA